MPREKAASLQDGLFAPGQDPAIRSGNSAP
jgi:hypothetical protein